MLGAEQGPQIKKDYYESCIPLLMWHLRHLSGDVTGGGGKDSAE